MIFLCIIVLLFAFIEQVAARIENIRLTKSNFITKLRKKRVVIVF